MEAGADTVVVNAVVVVDSKAVGATAEVAVGTVAVEEATTSAPVTGESHLESAS